MIYQIYFEIQTSPIFINSYKETASISAYSVRVYIVRTTFTTLIDRFTSVYLSTIGYEVTNWQLSCQLTKVALLTQSIM